MEAHCIGERYNGFNLTDCGNDHVTCDGGGDLFETHFNLQGTNNGAATEHRKKTN